MSEIKTFNVIPAHITQSPSVAGGEPCIAGRRIKVRHIYVWYDLMGMTADEIASQHNLTLAQVHAALTFAYEHLDEIRQAIQQEDALVADLKQTRPSKLQQKLSGRGE
jgi:uncharacterized protein (DUF433 family)